jgi:hypothetical protein
MKFQIGAMTVGDILDRGLKMLLTNLPAFYLINLMVLWPIIVLQIILPIAASSGSGTVVAIGGLLAFVLFLVLQPIGTAAILHIISQDFIDRRVSIGSAISFAMRRFGILLGTAILAGLVIGVGFILCVIPGILFSIWYVFYAQVVVVEGLGGMNALNRSKTLTEGFRGRVLGVLFLIFIITAIVSFSVSMLLETVLPSHELVPIRAKNQFDFGGVMGRPIYPNVFINVIVAQLLNILVQTYGAICATLLYFDLRNRKEGFDLELAARDQQTAEQP